MLWPREPNVDGVPILNELHQLFERFARGFADIGIVLDLFIQALDLKDIVVPEGSSGVHFIAAAFQVIQQLLIHAVWINIQNG